MILGPVLVVRKKSSVRAEVQIEFANGESQLLWYFKTKKRKNTKEQFFN
jgi:hypothetical protein